MSLPTLLLVEPQFVLRRTIGAVARELAIADVAEATSVDGAIALLAKRRCDLIVLDLSAEDAAVKLLMRLRRGELACAAGTPVIALTRGDPAALGPRFADCDLQRVMRKPLKISALLEAVRGVLAEASTLSLPG